MFVNIYAETIGSSNYATAFSVRQIHTQIEIEIKNIVIFLI